MPAFGSTYIGMCYFFPEFVLNPVGKTPLCILHEYVQHVLRVQPEYIFKELGKNCITDVIKFLHYCVKELWIYFVYMKQLQI